MLLRESTRPPPHACREPHDLYQQIGQAQGNQAGRPGARQADRRPLKVMGQAKRFAEAPLHVPVAQSRVAGRRHEPHAGLRPEPSDNLACVPAERRDKQHAMIRGYSWVGRAGPAARL